MDVRQNIELLYLLVLKELKIRYKNSTLGYLWALANPFAFAFVYWVAFKWIMRVEMENYSIFLITGLFPWLWLSNGVIHATRSYQNNAPLVKKVKLMRPILPLSNVVQEMAHFLCTLPVIVVFLLLTVQPMHASWLWQVPLMIAAQLLFTYSLASLFALANVFVHDVEYLVGISFSLLFFATPMVYPLSMVPEKYQVWFQLSPLHALIHSWREIMLHGRMDWPSAAYVVLFAALVGFLSYRFYVKAGHRIGELL
jgi:lipopolysaccharide transport system permease protein